MNLESNDKQFSTRPLRKKWVNMKTMVFWAVTLCSLMTGVTRESLLTTLSAFPSSGLLYFNSESCSSSFFTSSEGFCKTWNEKPSNVNKFNTNKIMFIWSYMFWPFEAHLQGLRSRRNLVYDYADLGTIVSYTVINIATYHDCRCLNIISKNVSCFIFSD